MIREGRDSRVIWKFRLQKGAASDGGECWGLWREEEAEGASHQFIDSIAKKEKVLMTLLFCLLCVHR